MMFRGLRSKLRAEHLGSLPWLFFYASLSIPLFYGVGMLFGPDSHFAVIDFWRFWVVHLWVEDFLEIFTTVTVAYMFVLIGLVPARTATRLIYLEIILYSIGGVVGTMHHLYFSGTPVIHMALGAFFRPWRWCRWCCSRSKRGGSCGSATSRRSCSGCSPTS
jgi:nitric oxide reductase subunit B